MRNIKKYKLNSDYTSKKNTFIYPTVSYVEENTNVYYKENQRIVTYTTTGASQQIKLINKQEYLDYCKIVDTGEELTVTGTGILNHTFENPGEHQVELKFKDDATTLASSFSGCSQLTSIPENLFSNNTKVTDFSNTFVHCTGLTGSIPESLFSRNTVVTNFSWTFSGCSQLTGSIPESLFSNCTAVTSFTSTFNGCSGLTGSIPEKLFSNNTAVTKFNYTFQYCTGLTSIPENLFSNNIKVTSFGQTFYKCSGLTGTVPTDTDGTPIYNRSTPGKKGYTVVTSYTGCFRDCTGLTDYSSIPSGWK